MLQVEKNGYLCYSDFGMTGGMVTIYMLQLRYTAANCQLLPWFFMTCHDNVCNTMYVYTVIIYKMFCVCLFDLLVNVGLT